MRLTLTPIGTVSSSITEEGYVRVVRSVVTVLVVVLLVGAAALGVLLFTNPEPTAMAGWTWHEQMPGPRGEAASTVGPLPEGGGEGLYAIGGFTTPAATSDEVAVYDPREDAWAQVTSLPEGRHHAGVASVDGRLVVAGGARSATGWEPTETVWSWRPGQDEWDTLDAMPEPRDSHGMVALDGRIYVIGGDGPSADVLVWEDGGWSRGAPLPEPRHHLSVVVLAGEIWAIGGRDDDDAPMTAVHVYDPGADEWREGPSLPDPTSASVAGVLGDRIHVVGGEDPAVLGGGVFDRHVWLEPGSAEWQRGPQPPLATHGTAGGVIDGRLYVAGGATRQGLLSLVSWTGFTASYEHEEPT